VSGTDSLPVVFEPLDGVTKWSGIAIRNDLGGRGSISYAQISHATTAVSVSCCWEGGPLSITDSTIENSTVGVGGYAGWDIEIDRVTFRSNQYAITRADKTIRNSVFENNDYGLYETERIDVYDSLFVDSNEVALFGGRGIVSGCTIEGNNIGIKAFFEGFTVENNSINNNRVGIITGHYDGNVPIINSNSINGNTEYNLMNPSEYSVDAKNNWWGTVDKDLIKGAIYDGYDEAGLGIVSFEPYLEESVFGE